MTTSRRQKNHAHARSSCVLVFAFVLVSLFAVSSFAAAPAKYPKGKAAEASANSVKSSKKEAAKAPKRSGGAMEAMAETAKIKSLVSNKGKNPKAAPAPKVDWTERPRSYTRTLKSFDAARAIAVSEVHALALESKYLVVPLDFVVESWLAKPGVRFAVDEPAQEARIAEIDLASGVALLQVSKPMAGTLTRAQLRLDAPSTEEPLLALLTRDYLKTGARFVRAKSDGGTQRFQIAEATESRTPAHYVFDKSGRLVALGAGEGAWATTGAAVAQILKNQDPPKPASVGGFEQVRQQLFNWQLRVARAFSPSAKAVQLRSLECQQHHAVVNDRAIASLIRKVDSIECGTRFPLALGGGYSAGLSLVTGEVQATSETARAAKAFGIDAFEDQKKNASLVNLMTVPECGENSATNRAGHLVQVKYCTSALKMLPGLNDTVVEIASVDGQRAFVSVARLKGFGLEQSKLVMEALIENARSVK